ncbi:farnesyl pyrophosphate synthase [Eupeodes corollae]|uniref:farnesyl pyrophosphate synthase n=1 Tax=Eupeodes corollae TaxID=290404 RepID=UPI00248FE71B|nr:farnesyl pyrophosphate synthase [Eupeodes corollae]
MFSIIRKLPMGQVVRPLIVNNSVAPTAGAAATKLISTTENPQNSEHMTKIDKIGGLPSDLVNKKKMKTTLRTLSTLNYSMPLAARATVSKDESRDFMAVFPDLVRELTEKANEYNAKQASKWFAKALQYNVPRGKKNRGLLTVLTYKKLVSEDQLTPENIKNAQYLGWCVEMLQSMFIIADDIMDGSTTRRGQVCWHKLDDVGMTAINDSLMIENAIFTILKNHFRQSEAYADLLDLFHEVIFITTCGQSLDLLTANKDISSFTMDKYKSIVANKTAYYSFYLPFALAMHLAGFKDAEAFRQAKTILLEMGHFYQVQDDFLDCFGNPEVTGKLGTDIQDNKCSWLAVVCMQRANDDQKKIMAECYGKNDPAKIARVKQLYKELGLPNTYATYEEESYNMIKTHIQQTSRGVPHELYLQVLNKIYHRDS